MPRVVHLGAGALGLGLVGPACSESGLSVVVANRRGSARNDLLARQRAYEHHVSPALLQSTRRTIEKFVFFDEEDELEELVASADTVLLTTALKEYGLKAVEPLLTRLLEARLAQGTELFVVACENAVDSTALAARLPKGVAAASSLRFVRCVVDRICNSPFVAHDLVHVETEEFERWYLERSEFTGTLEQVLQGPAIEFVDDLDLIIRRKKWLVNAAHQLTAICAHQFGFLHLDRFLAHPLGRMIADGVLAELSQVYEHNEPFAEGTASFVGELRRRLESHPSFVPTALTRLAGKDLLEGFFADFHRKVGEPAQTFLQADALRWLPLSWTYLTNIIALGNYVPRP